MADTNHVQGVPPVEGDGVSYSGIVWFVVILTVTTLFCQLIVWGAFEFMEWRAVRSEPTRAPLAAAPAAPAIENGAVVTGNEMQPTPSLLVHEPAALQALRENEAAAQSSYAWVDQGAGIVRLPIDRAKALVIERGLPARPGAGPANPAPPAPVAANPPATPASGGAASGH